MPKSLTKKLLYVAYGHSTIQHARPTGLVPRKVVSILNSYCTMTLASRRNIDPIIYLEFYS